MTTAWLTMLEVCERFRCGVRRVRHNMRVPADAVERAWTNQGSTARPDYRFGPGLDDIDCWWRECNEWRTRECSEAGSTKSGGATPTEKSAHGASRRKPTRRRTSASSAGAKNSGPSGDPNDAVIHHLSSGLR
jgi:hypothetical protein